jgi:pyruvate kinase
VADGIVAAAREIAEATNIKAICCFSQSGTTVSLVARERPACADHRADAAGVHRAADGADLGRALRDRARTGTLQGRGDRAVRAARSDGFATRGPTRSSSPPACRSTWGTTNILRVAPCDERLISRVDPG